MKVRVLLAAVLAALCCSAVAGAQPVATTSASPPRLEGSAARDAAQAKVRRLKVRSEQIDEITATGCRRKSQYRFDCFYYASGETSTRASACRLRVMVEGAGFVASSVRLRISCRSRPILSYSRAKGAMLAELELLAGRPVGLIAIARQSHGRFTGYAEWTGEGAVVEECATDLAASLSRSGSFSVASHDLRCRVAGAAPAQNAYFRQYVEPGPEIEPIAITIGTGTLGGTFSTTSLIDWRGWGTDWTTASGYVHFRGCLPTCVQGRLFNLPAIVVLDRVESLCGQRRYSRIRIMPKGGPYPIIGPYGVDCDGSLVF